jgi:hypothetical protein
MQLTAMYHTLLQIFQDILVAPIQATLSAGWSFGRRYRDVASVRGC